jgi:tRNA pseudouridine38-40 synthase
MARFRLDLEYEGTRYSGWQIQKNARTVQGDIMGALKTVFGTDRFEFYGSGRTDAGVHALQQTAHLDIQTQLSPQIIRMKINDNLPADINILRVEKAHKHFHARHDAITRSYLYQISRRRTAFGKRFVWWIKDELDMNRMQEAARHFTGMKDFRSFTADDPEEKSTKVLLDELRIEEAGSLILLRVRGSHFLWKMVRQIVGVLAETGRGKMSPNDVAALFRSETNVPAQFTAPPSGLFLEGAYYQGDVLPQTLEPVMGIR